MPNMDGTGPCCGGQHLGNGHRGGHHGRAHHGYAGCRCVASGCCQPAYDEKEALTLRKEALQRNLDAIDKRLETL